MIEVNLPVFIVQIITFFIALWLVGGSMIKALANTIRKRDEFIRDSIDKIEKDKADMEKMKTDYEAKVRESHEKAAAAVTKAVADGEKIKDQIIADARKEGAKLVEEAKKDIEAEKLKAIESVKDTIVDISIMTAEKVLRKKIGQKEHVAIVDDYLKDIGKN
ncbi:MAG: F0F1 ATP synthase subunit B [Spirochaetia bacterium]|nr:F0F1 ATP synthase subunit B [Spirochaetia bacterium]